MGAMATAACGCLERLRRNRVPLCILHRHQHAFAGLSPVRVVEHEQQRPHFADEAP